MKATLATLLISATIAVSAQSNQLQNASNYLRNKEYDKAKAAADAASENESTKGSAKLWMYRGQIYQAIYESKDQAVRALDNDAQEKSVESYINCLKLDKDNIYKDQVKGNIVQAAVSLNNKALLNADMKNFEASAKELDLVEQALPYDFDQGMKRNNITKEGLMFTRFKVYSLSGDKAKTKEYADKLIDMKYKDVSIYKNMVKLSLIDKDTTAALNYISKGKILFEDNMDLITKEIDIYLAQHKTNELKTKLNDAIAVAPDNEVLHSVLANLYEKTNDSENAEKEYLKALELKPDFDVANYNLGVIYFNMGNQWNEKLNALPLSENKKAKEYETKANEYFQKATVYLEKAYEVTPDGATKQRLRKLFLKLGNTEKADKYK